MNSKNRLHAFSICCMILINPYLLSFAISSESESAIGRIAAYKGSWYPGSKSELEKTIHELLNAARPEKIEGKITAIISPHAGYRYSGKCAAYAYKSIAGKNYNRVFLLGFSHRSMIQGCAVSSFDYYETPLGKVMVDRKVCDKLLKKELFSAHAEAEKQEHSIEIQIPFLQMVLKDFTIIPLMVGALNSSGDYKAVAAGLKEFIDNKTLIVVSSDMTHYGPDYEYLPFTANVKENLRTLDFGALAKIMNIDLKGFQDYLAKTGDTICGSRPIGVLLSLLDKNSKGTLLRYETSGEMLGDFKNSVSYAAIAFALVEPLLDKSENDLNKQEQQMLLRLARETIIQHLTGKGTMESLVSSRKLTDRMKEKRGVFVTIKKNGELRGCIGYIQGIVPLYQAVIDNAVSASTRDYRFPQMTASEIAEVKLEISAMTPLKKISSTDEIIVGRHGLYIEYAGRHGVLLPQVATENSWSRDQFLNAVCRKAGLPENTWKTANPVLWVFSAQVFGED